MENVQMKIICTFLFWTWLQCFTGLYWRRTLVHHIIIEHYSILLKYFVQLCISVPLCGISYYER